MTIHVDDKALSPQPKKDQTLGQVIETVGKGLSRSGRIIVEVRRGEESLTGKGLETQMSAPTGDEDIHLVSAPRDELISQTLDMVRSRLTDANNLQADAARLLQQDQLQQAMQAISSVLEAWTQVQQAVLQSVHLASLPLEHIEADGEKLEELANALIDQLKQVRDLLKAGDTVALADALQYEWPTMTQRWDRMIGAIITTVQKSQA
ncbi:MAG: hypothetical protein GC164_03085 [Phycisphaera sp.]|nr:hypothetical protein [Phycisphaera sp.]